MWHLLQTVARREHNHCVTMDGNSAQIML